MVGGAVLIGLLVLDLLFPPSAAARQRTKIAARRRRASRSCRRWLATSSPTCWASASRSTCSPSRSRIFPVAIGWAIVKDDLFEVDAIIRRAVAWALLTGCHRGHLSRRRRPARVWFAGRASRVAQLFFLLGAGRGAQPTAQPGADRDRLPVCARASTTTGKIVDEASQALATLLDLDRVVERILTTITETDARRVRRRVAARRGRRLSPAGASPAALPPALPKQARDADSALDQAPSPAVRSTSSARRRWSGATSTPAEQLCDAGHATCWCRWRSSAASSALIALGAQAIRAASSPARTSALLRTLANQGGAWRCRTRSLYHTLKRVNQELRDAQSRLDRSRALRRHRRAVGAGRARHPQSARRHQGGGAVRRASTCRADGIRCARTSPTSSPRSTSSRGASKALLDFARPFEPHPRAVRRRPDRARRARLAAHADRRAEASPSTTDIDAASAAGAARLRADRAGAAGADVERDRSDAARRPPGGQRRTGAARRPAHRGGRHRTRHSTRPAAAPSSICSSPASRAAPGLGLAFAKKIVELHRRPHQPPTSALALGSRFTIDAAGGPPAVRAHAAAPCAQRLKPSVTHDLARGGLPRR